MKINKLLICTFSFVVMLSFYGCQSRQEADTSQIQKVVLSQEKRMGVIQSLGGAYNSSKATHLLRMENGKTIFLKSSALDLGSEKYAKKVVEVAGDLVRMVDNEQVMDVKSIDLIEKENVIQDSTPQWKDYSSNKLGVKFRYRDDFQLLEKDNLITLIGKTQHDPSSVSTSDPAITSSVLGIDGYSMTVSIKLLSDSKDFNLLGSLGIVADNSVDLSAKGFSKSKITLHAIDAYKEADNNGHKISYYLKILDKSYLIMMDINKSDNNIQDQNLFYDILASIDFDEYSDTKTSN